MRIDCKDCEEFKPGRDFHKPWRGNFLDALVCTLLALIRNRGGGFCMHMPLAFTRVLIPRCKLSRGLRFWTAGLELGQSQGPVGSFVAL